MEHYIKKKREFYSIALYAIFYRSPDIDQDNRNREIGQSSADEFLCIEYGSIPDQYLLFWMVEKMNYHNRCEVENEEILKSSVRTAGKTDSAIPNCYIRMQERYAMT